jgi:undecaprenyl diphosphate synthase
VTPTLWPDFGEPEFVDALARYQRRERRFGRTTDQLEDERIGAAR